MNNIVKKQSSLLSLPGLYIITNNFVINPNAPLKIYVGTTSNVQSRYIQHNEYDKDSQNNSAMERVAKSKGNKKLYDMMSEFGKQNFSFDVVSYFNPIVEIPNNTTWVTNRISANERRMIIHRKSVNPEFGYNNSTGGEGASSSKIKNFPQTEFKFLKFSYLYYNIKEHQINVFKDIVNDSNLIFLELTNNNYVDEIIELYKKELDIKNNNDISFNDLLKDEEIIINKDTKKKDVVIEPGVLLVNLILYNLE